MFDKLKGFFKTTAIYGVVGSIRSFSEFLLLPLYARFLTPEDFGTLDILMIYVMVGMVLAVLEMNNAAFRFYFDKDSFNHQQEVISSSFIATSLNGFVIFLISIWLAEKLSLLLYDTPDNSNLFYIAGLIIFLNSICTVPFNLLRIRNKPAQYTILSLALVSISIGCTVVLLAKYKMGAEGILLAKALAFIPIVLISLFVSRHHIRIRINFRMIGSMLKYSLPLIPAGMAIWGINGLNRIFMIHYLSLEQIGYFSLASKFVVVITLSVIAFQLAWPQFAFSNMNTKNVARTFSQVFNVCAALGIWLVLFITMFSGNFINIAMSKKFLPAIGAVMPLATGMFFYGIFYFFTTGAIIEKKTSSILFPLISAMVFNIVMNIIVTPVYGFKGTAWVTLASYFIMAIAMFLMIRNSKYIELNYVKIFRLAVASSIVLPVAILLSYENSVAFLVVKSAFFLSFPFILWLIGFIDRITATAVADILKRKTNSKIMFVKKSNSAMEANPADRIVDRNSRQQMTSPLDQSG